MKKQAVLLISVFCLVFAMLPVSAESSVAFANRKISVMILAADFTASDRGMVTIAAPDGSFVHVESFNGGFAEDKEICYNLSNMDLLGTYTVTVSKTDINGTVTEQRNTVDYQTNINLTDSTVDVKNVKLGSILIIASYSDNKLNDMKVRSLTEDTSITISGTGLDTEGAGKICAMIWDDLNSLKPCAKAEKISLP